ncbi:MAG: hypothetical protein QNK54_01530 [Candidatus Planktophila sp.]
MATSCSSGNEQVSGKPTVTPPTEIVTSSPTPDPTPTPGVSPSTEPSTEPDPTQTASTQPKTKESKSVVTPSATPTPTKSKAPSKPSPSTKKLTNAELALKYPPTIGTLVPWYFPTPEQAGKAYTNLKPYETGKTYALYQEDNSLLLVYPGVGTTYLDGDTVVWGAYRINKVKSYEITMDENSKTDYGMEVIDVLVCEGGSCSPIISRNIMHIELIPKNLPGVFQKWTPIKTFR